MTQRKVRLSLIFLCLFLFLSQLLPAKVSAAPSISSFYVTRAGGKDIYYEGEHFSAEGYEGTVIYSDSTQAVLSSGLLSWSVADPLTESTNVIFSYRLTNIKCSLPVTVKKLTRLTVSGNYRTDYRAGWDTFDPTGMILTLEYSDGTKITTEYTQNSGAIVTSSGKSSLVPSSGDFVFSPAPGETFDYTKDSVKIDYTLGTHTLTAIVPVNVKSVTGLEVRECPSGAFYEGSKLQTDSSSLAVYATYSTGSEAIRVYDYTIVNRDSPITAGQDGKMHYTVSFCGKTADFAVDVIKIREVKATATDGIKNIYMHSSANVFSPEGIKVTAYYTDSSSIDVTSSAIFSYPAVFHPGDTVTASFCGYSIDLSKAVAVHTATVEMLTSREFKTEYKEGEHFSFDGLIANVVYDDGEIYIPDESELYVSSNGTAISFAEYSSSALLCSDWYVRIGWNGAESDLEFRVIPAEETYIEIATEPDIVKYINSQTFDPTGMEVHFIRGNEITVLSSGQLEFTPSLSAALTVSDTEISVRYYLSPTVYYETVQAIEVSAKTISNIYVSRQPTKVRYNEGDPLITDGLELTVVYNDLSTSTVRSGFTASRDLLILRTGETEPQILIYYGGKSCTLDGLSVEARTVDRITVSNQPDKTAYEAGESFDPTGMTVSVYFTDSKTQEYPLDSSFYTIYPTDALTAGTSYVSVSFRGVSTKCAISVKGEATTQADETSIPDVTTAEITTDVDDVSEDPVVTTDTPETQATTTAGQSVTTDTTEPRQNSNTTILVLWIVVLIIIAVAIVGLIIYYKKNFT